MGGEAEFAMADVEALRALMALVDAGYVSYEESIELVRAIGQHTHGSPSGRETSSPDH